MDRTQLQPPKQWIQSMDKALLEEIFKRCRRILSDEILVALTGRTS